MIDEERNASEEAQEEGSAAPEETPAEDTAPDADADAPEEAPAPEETDAAADADAPEEAPAPAADDTPAAAADEPAEPPAPTHPKQIRKQARSRHAGAARPPRSADERAAERATRRRERAQGRRSWRQKQRAKRGDRPASVDASPPKEHGPGRPRERQGVVVSDRADKTITVRIDVTRQHPTYEKIVRSSSMLHAHDERNEAGVGDTVRLVESRPLSRTKRWRLVDVLERAR